ncbi:MAG: MoxR family ATPase [Acidobacteriota bacterium]
MDAQVKEVQRRVDSEAPTVARLIGEVRTVIVGQQALLDRLVIALLARGHVLVEGVPGLAKTLAVKSLAGAVSATFQRVQFTPDLLPADLVGTLVYNPKEGVFEPKKGPIFTQILLADEINRAPAKVQSALLECMQERQVTLGGTTHLLPEPFFVMATQNPIEQEGTYPLPEAQVDRFLMKVVLTYPTPEEERQIIDRMATAEPPAVKPVLSVEDVLRARKVADSLYVDARIKDYVVRLVQATRNPGRLRISAEGYVRYGASPRAALFLTLAAKAHAFLRGRAYVTPEDVKAVGLDVLRHRLILTYEAEAESVTPESLLARIFEGVEVP